MRKYYSETRFANENIPAKTNLGWVADIAEIELDQPKKLSLFLCVYAHLNIIIANNISRKTITSSAIVTSLSKAIEKRFVVKPTRKVIIPTDQGNQFSSQVYNRLTSHYQPRKLN